ncbi:hypothetical protein [Streptomyces shenzhenensis]|uniref:hypothetical protein n=1 Tax=Streptomyces shenzhenensis TaxID=943815 RepID=UPI001F188608|nr:hypothetical protein [Streptomyces shenzhenensis]
MKNRVDWTDERLGSTVYEDMVSVLISRLHPQAQRIDGSGGDDGRDVQLPLPTGLEIFELKSFTGRLDEKSGRRRQVKNSLNNAAKHNPVAWHLVVPINHTDGELKWFNDLTAKYPFPCVWRGKDWLDSQMASYPELPRYYLEGSNDEIVSMMREINQEQAALTRGVTDLAARVRTLKDRLNSLDPHYSFGFEAHPDGSVKITVAPRYPGAERDRPITMGGAFQFPETEEGRKVAQAVHDTFNYGTATVVPGEYVKHVQINAPAGFGGTYEGGELRIGAAINTPPQELRVVLRIQDERGFVVAQLPLKALESTVGLRGGVLTLVDLNSTIKVTARFDTVTSRIKLHYDYHQPDGCLPGTLLPTVNFLREMKPERYFVMEVNGQEIGPPIDIPESGTDGYALPYKFLLLLADIQRISGVYFPMPKTLTTEEVDALGDAHAFLTNNTATGQWSELNLEVTVEGLSSPDMQQLEKDREARDVWLNEPLLVKLGDNTYMLGVTRKTLATVRVATWPEIPDEATPDTKVTVALKPGPDPSVTIAIFKPET